MLPFKGGIAGLGVALGGELAKGAPHERNQGLNSRERGFYDLYRAKVRR